MARTKRLICWAALAAVCLAGCEAESQQDCLRKAGAKVVSLRIEDTKLYYATLLFEVEVDNPCPTSLSLVSLRYSLTSGGNTFLTATDLAEQHVGPNEKRIVSLRDMVFYKRLLDALRAKPGSEIAYQSRVWLHADGTEGGSVELTGGNDGVLALPSPPGLELEGKTYNYLDVAYVATPPDVVDKMLEVAQVTKDDLLCDLGCGDGRIPVTAAGRYGCRAVGYDLDTDRVKESLENVKKHKVEHLVRIEQKDIFTLDLSEMSVVTMYLLPSLNVRLVPQLEKLKPGTRIVSHDFAMRGFEPDKVVKIYSIYDNREHTIYLWTAPIRRAASKIAD